MYFKNDTDIEHIAFGVIDCTLPKPEWTHAAHFAAAIWLLDSPTYEAFAEMPDIIKRYNEASGVANTDTEGYHETITIVSLKAARWFMDNASDTKPLFEIVNKLMASEFGKSDWLLAYWTKDLLFSPKARREWVEPDLAQIPF